jgi:peptidoglycan/xylan/chitin deacetylase (PgdA/CDA1 family)
VDQRLSLNKQIPGLLATLSALLITTSALAADSAVVLMYHRFGEDRFPSTSIRVEQFQAHLKYLKESGFAVVPLADVHAAINNGMPLPERAVAITIDDAYRSVYDVAFPLFKAYGYPFTVFVATNAVDDGLPGTMTWDQMREMATAGATFANHGAAHSSTIEREDGATDEEWLAAVRSDIEKGAKRIAEELPLLQGSFAYPYGEYTSDVSNLLQDMGYDSFGQHSGAVGPDSDHRALPRFPMAESFGDIAQFRTKVASVPMPVKNVDPWEPITADAQPTITITLGETDARLGELACYVSGQGKVEVDWQETDSQFVVGPAKPFNKGRQRVNCTAPGNDGRYLWFSHQWIIQP